MKLLFIALLLSSVAALPRIFNKHNSKTVRAIGIRGTGMTTTSIRTYFKQQRHRQQLHAARSRQNRMNNILNTYFKLRDVWCIDTYKLPFSWFTKKLILTITGICVAKKDNFILNFYLLNTLLSTNILTHYITYCIF